MLIEDPTKAPGSLNHLGVEVASTEEVPPPGPAVSAGVKTEVEDQVACCYALQDKVWALGPRGELGVLHRPGRRRDAGGPAPRLTTKRGGMLH